MERLRVLVDQHKPIFTGGDAHVAKGLQIAYEPGSTPIATMFSVAAKICFCHFVVATRVLNANRWLQPEKRLDRFGSVALSLFRLEAAGQEVFQVPRSGAGPCR